MTTARTGEGSRGTEGDDRWVVMVDLSNLHGLAGLIHRDPDSLAQGAES